VNRTTREIDPTLLEILTDYRKPQPVVVVRAAQRDSGRFVPYRFIEWHLYNYWPHKEWVEFQREKIIESGVLLSAATLMTKVSNSNQDDSTQRKAIQLVDNRPLMRMQDDLTAIERALVSMSKECRDIIARRYWSGTHGDRETAKCLYMGGAKYRRLKRHALQLVAREMGLHIPTEPELSTGQPER
jgi:hypothetical protein